MPVKTCPALDRPRRRLLATPLLAAALPSWPSWLAAAPAGLDARLQALVNDPARPLAGLSVLVLRAGRVVYQGQFGHRWIAPSPAEGQDLPVTPDTLFRVASVSKLIVALGVLRLAEAGRLGLDTDVSEWLGFTLRHPGHPRRPLTLRLLLSHRAGLRDAGGTYLLPGQTLAAKLLPGGARYGRGESWSPAAQAPGDYFEYCNLNFGVIASVMERASGQRFDRLMQALVLQPLGMAGGFEASSFSQAELDQVATLYRKRPTDDDAPWSTAGPWIVQTDELRGQRPAPPPGLDDYVLGSNGSLFGPQGRLRTRVADLGTVAAVLARGGRHEGQVFLRPDSLAQLFTEQWRFDGRNGDSERGLFRAWGTGAQHFIDRSDTAGGDRLLDGGGQQAWGHLGFAYGLVSGLLVDPASGNGVVYAINGTGADPARHPGRYSSFPAWEERLQGLLWERARA